SDKMSSLIAEWLKDPTGDALVLMESDNLGPRSSLRKLFEGATNAAAIACYVQDERSLAQFIRTELRTHNIQIEDEALDIIASHAVGDRLIARQEIEKILTYLG